MTDDPVTDQAHHDADKISNKLAQVRDETREVAQLLRELLVVETQIRDFLVPRN